MSVRHAAGAVFKAFAAHVTVFFVRMAYFALTVLRVTRNMVAVMMFMSAAAAFFVFMTIIWLVLLLPSTTNMMPLKPSRLLYWAPSICWGWPKRRMPRYCRLLPAKCTVTPLFIPKWKVIGEM